MSLNHLSLLLKSYLNRHSSHLLYCLRSNRHMLIFSSPAASEEDTNPAFILTATVFHDLDRKGNLPLCGTFQFCRKIQICCRQRAKTFNYIHVHVYSSLSASLAYFHRTTPSRSMLQDVAPPYHASIFPFAYPAKYLLIHSLSS